MQEVLTLAEAARALRVRRGAGAAWLRERGLVVTIAGQERVYWPAVAAQLAQGAQPAAAPQPELPRAGLAGVRSSTRKER